MYIRNKRGPNSKTNIRPRRSLTVIMNPSCQTLTNTLERSRNIPLTWSPVSNAFRILWLMINIRVSWCDWWLIQTNHINIKSRGLQRHSSQFEHANIDHIYHPKDSTEDCFAYNVCLIYSFACLFMKCRGNSPCNKGHIIRIITSKMKRII